MMYGFSFINGKIWDKKRDRVTFCGNCWGNSSKLNITLLQMIFEWLRFHCPEAGYIAVHLFVRVGFY